jgi:hypothetical protein
VLTGHVHNYQRIDKQIGGSEPTPFIVAGNGGYYHLHNLTAKNCDLDPTTGPHLIASEDTRHGYLTLTVTANTISGSYTTITKGTGKPVTNVDTFEYPTALVTLPAKAVASL